jgi:nitroimidazol reductase NimA-like FMN-containing flavoprotein (pyridoxamine 5'-phosphate oxidase superfamily)
MAVPRQILKLLKEEKFCFLATSYQDHPHVSLMNFTYLQEEELIVLSSRANTTKVKYIEKNPAVALLIYSLSEGPSSVSCTLYGLANVVNPDKDHHYRDSHYSKHRDMGKFITGENISIITVRISNAALSDLDDSVRTWAPGSIDTDKS